MVHIDAKVTERPFSVAKLQSKIIEHDANCMYEVLEDCSWNFEKKDLHHWIPLLNHFDTYLEKALSGRQDLVLRDLSKTCQQQEELPKRNVLAVLRATCVLLRVCAQKHIYRSLEVVSLLLAHEDQTIAEAAMDVLLEYSTKKSPSSVSSETQHWSSRLQSYMSFACRLKDVTLADFVSEKRNFQVEELCSVTMKLSVMEGFDRMHKKNSGSLDLSPAKDSTLSDIGAVQAVMSSSSLSLDQTSSVIASVHFAVLLRVRAIRQCQSVTFRQFVLRMRMKGMYALFSSQKNASAKLLETFNRSEGSLLEEVQGLILDTAGVPLPVRRDALFGVTALALAHRQQRSPSIQGLVSSGKSSFLAVVLDQVVKWLLQQNEGEAGGASTSRCIADNAPCDSTYVDAFMSVLHSLLTLFTAPGPGGVPAEGWVVPSMLEALSCTAPAYYDSLTTMLKMLDIYLEVHGPACTTFLERGGCGLVLQAAEDLMLKSQAFITAADEEASSKQDAAGSSGAADGSCGWPPTDLGTVPASNRNYIKAAVNVYFQARYGQAAQEGAAQACEFKQFSGICATLLRSAPHYGGSLLFVCIRRMVDMVHMDPTHFLACWEGGMPEAFIEMLQAGVLPDSSVVTLVPMMVEALCLHEKGRTLVAEHHPLRALVPILSHKAYVIPDASGGSPLQLCELAAGLEELVRHMPHELSYQAVDAVLAVLRVLCAAGGDPAALKWHPNMPTAAAPGAEPDSQMATDEVVLHMPEEMAGTRAAGSGDTADVLEHQYPAAVRAQQGWLPGLGHGGVVLEWSRAVPDTQKLEVMLGNAISILDTMTTLSTAHAGIWAMHGRGGFDLTLRLHDLPNMPPALLLERNLKPSLIPQHLLRTSQTEVLAHIAPLCITSTAAHVQAALDALDPFCNKTPEAAFDEGQNSAASAASAVARALSGLALAAEVIRVAPNVLDRLTASGARGQSLISNVSKLEFMCKPLVETMSVWLDCPALRKRLSSVAEHLRDTTTSSSGDVDPMESARVSAILARVSAKENKLANRMAVAVPHLQLLALLQGNVDGAVRNFHLSVCKSVHHPSSRNRRAGGTALSQPIDPTTGCILNASSRLCLAYLVQGRKTCIDRSVLPTPSHDSSPQGATWPPQHADASSVQTDSTMEGPDEGVPELTPRAAFAAMQNLTMMADDVRMCLFEMRRKEYFALALGYFNTIGGIQSISSRFHDAVKIAQVVHMKAEEEQQQQQLKAAAATKAEAEAKASTDAPAADSDRAPPASSDAAAPGAAAATELQAAADTDVSEMQVDGGSSAAVAADGEGEQGEEAASAEAAAAAAAGQHSTGVSDFGVPRLGRMYFDVIERQWCFAFDAQAINTVPAASAAAATNRQGADAADGAAGGDGKLTAGKLLQSSWTAASKYIPQMLSTYLTFFSLLLHRRPLISHPASSLLGEPLPDARGSSPSEAAARPAEVALLSLQTAAAKAVLMLWDAAIAFKPDAALVAAADGSGSASNVAAAPSRKNFLPPQVLSHLVSALCIAYVSQADNGRPPPVTVRQMRANMFGSATAARPPVRRPFVPSESAISSMSDQMGFPREQVEYVVNRLQTNEVAVLANYFLEHDVESMMRASQVSAARRETASATAAAAARGAAVDPGAAGSSAAVAAAADRTERAADDDAAAAVPDDNAAETATEADAAVPMAVVEEPDALAQALKDSLHVASNQGVEPDAPEGLGLPELAAIGEGLMQLSLEQPQHVFLLCPLLQQAAEGAPEQMLEWASSKIKSAFSSKDACAAASSSTAAPLQSVSDSDRRMLLHVLLLLFHNGSAKVARKLASSPSVLPVMFRAAVECAAEYKAMAAAADTSAHKPGTLDPLPAWINVVLALAGAVSQLQADVTPPPPPPRERRSGEADAAGTDAGQGTWSQGRAFRDGSVADQAAAVVVSHGRAQAALAALQAASDNLMLADAADGQAGTAAEQPGDAEPQAAADDTAAPMDADPPVAADEIPLRDAIANSVAAAAARLKESSSAVGAGPVAPAKAEEFAQARLGPHWQPCGMLGEDNERMLTTLCCDLIDVLHKFAECMPQPALLSLTEPEVHACMHPRTVLFNVLQLLMQLGRRWGNARRLSEAGCGEMLLSMPVPTLCTGSLEDITTVLQQIMEDPTHTYPALCDDLVRSIFVRHSGARAVSNIKQYAMPLRGFLSSAANEGYLDRHPAAFSCAVARTCELLPGDSGTLRLRASPAATPTPLGGHATAAGEKPSADPAAPGSSHPGGVSGSAANAAAPSSCGSGSQASKRASLVPAKRNGDGKVKHRKSDATASEASAPEASVPEASSSTGEATGGSNGLPSAFSQTISAVVKKLAEAYSACVSDTSKSSKSTKSLDARQRLLENAWCMNPENVPQFRVALSLHILVQFILRYSAALPAIMAASAELQLPAVKGHSAGPAGHSLLDLVLFRLPPAVLSLTGMAAMYSPLLVNSMVRFASAVSMRSKELGGALIGLVFTQLQKYRATLESSPPSGKISSKLAFMPVSDSAVTHRLHVYTALLQVLTSFGATPWGSSMTRDAARALRDAGAVEILPQILETVNFSGRAGNEGALRLLGVIAGAVHVDQNGVPKIRAFMQNALRGSRLTNDAGRQDMRRLDQTGQRLLRNNALLAALEGSTGTSNAAVAAVELAANMHTTVGNSNLDLSSLHPSILRTILPQAARQTSRAQSDIVALMHETLTGHAGRPGPSHSMWVTEAPQQPGVRHELVLEEADQVFAAGLGPAPPGVPHGAEGLDADFEEHRTYIDSVLEDADQGGQGDPPDYPALDHAGEEEEAMDVDLDAEQGAEEGLSDGEHGLPGGGSSDGEEEEFPDAPGHHGHSSDDNYPDEDEEDLPVGMHQAIAANAAAGAAAMHGAGSGEDVDFSEEDGEQAMDAVHDHDDVLDGHAHTEVAAEVASAAGLAADLHVQMNAAAEAAARAEEAAGADAEAADAAEPTGGNAGNNSEWAGAGVQHAHAQEGQQEMQEAVDALEAHFQPPQPAAPQNAAVQLFENMAEAEMEEDRLLPLAMQHPNAADLHGTAAAAEDLQYYVPHIPLVREPPEELIFPGGMPDGTVPLSYEVAWGAAMGGGPVTHGAVGPDGSIRFIPANRRPGRGDGADGGVDRIFPTQHLRMFTGGGSTAGIASMLFGDLGAGGTRGGALADGGMARLATRFPVAITDDEGGRAQRLVQLRGVDPRGQERPIAASLLSRMLGMTAPGGGESHLDLLEAIGFAPMHGTARANRSQGRGSDQAAVPEAVLLLLMERSSDNLRTNAAMPTAARTTNMLLLSPSQQATENAGANAGAPLTAYQNTIRNRDGARGEDPRTQGGATALVRTNALTQSILTEAISYSHGAGPHDAQHAGTLRQRHLGGIGMGVAAGRREHPLISRQLGGVSILEAAVSEMLAPQPQDTGAAGGERRTGDRRADMFRRPYGQPGIRSASAVRNAIAQERRAHAAAVAEQHHRVHEAMMQSMHLRSNNAADGAAGAAGAPSEQDNDALNETRAAIATEVEQIQRASEADAADAEAPGAVDQSEDAAREALAEAHVAAAEAVVHAAMAAQGLYPDRQYSPTADAQTPAAGAPANESPQEQLAGDAAPQEDEGAAAQPADVEMAASEDEARSQGDDRMDTSPPAGTPAAPAASAQANAPETPAADGGTAGAPQPTGSPPPADDNDAAVPQDDPPQDAQHAAPSAEAAAAQAGPSTAAAAEDAPAAPAENGILTARVRERAAAAGLDVAMLEALPSDLVRETLLAYGVDPTDRGAGGADDSRAALSALIPPELLNEGLAAEREAALRRSAQAATAAAVAAPAAGEAPAEGATEAEVDPARAAAAEFAETVVSFPPDALEDALASLPAEITEHLPGPLRTQAMRLQGRRNFRSLRELTELRAAQRTAAAHGAPGAAPREVHISLSQVVLREFPEASVLPSKPLKPPTPTSDLSTNALAVIIKIIACNATSSTSAWVSHSRTQAAIQESGSAILLGCLSSQESVSRLCSLFLSTITTFMVEPAKHSGGSSGTPKFVWGLSLSRASLCPSTSRAGVVLGVLLDTMQDLARFDRHVAQALLAPLARTTAAADASASSSNCNQEPGTPAVLTLLQLLTSNITQACKTARLSALQLLDCLLASAGALHIGDTCRKPPAASTQKLPAQAKEPKPSKRAVASAAQADPTNAPAGDEAAAPAEACPMEDAAAPDPIVSAGPVTRRRRRLNSGLAATTPPPRPTLGTAAGSPSNTDAADAGASPTPAAADPPTPPAKPTPALYPTTRVAVIPTLEPRSGVVALRNMATAPVVEFVRSMVARPSAPSRGSPASASKKATYDLVTTAAASKCIVQLCQLAPHLLAPVFDAVIAVFGTVRDQVSQAFATKSGNIGATNIDSAGRVLLDMVSLLQQLLAVTRYYSKYSALLRAAGPVGTATTEGTSPGSATADAAQRGNFAGVPAELNSPIEEVSGQKTAVEAVSCGNVARAHAIAHNELLAHLRKVSDEVKAELAKREEAGPSGTTNDASDGARTGTSPSEEPATGMAALRPEAGEAAQDQSGAAAAGNGGSSGVDPGQQAAGWRPAGAGRATEGSGSVPEGYVCMPPPMDSEAGVSSLPSAESLMRKLRELVEPSELWQAVSKSLTAAEGDLPKTPPGTSCFGHQGIRPPLPATVAALQPLVECYFAICSACSLVAAPQAPPALDVAVSPEDVASGAYVDASSAEQGMQVPATPGAAALASSNPQLPAPVPESPAGSGPQSSAAQQFMETHRVALNAYLQHHPKLLEGAFSFLLATPRLVDFANKAAFFRAKVVELKERHRAPPCSIAVHRSQAFEESFRQLKSKSPAELRGGLQVRFHGEEGIDMGGLTREWYEVMAKAICDPNLALFQSEPDRAQTYQPSKNAVIQNESMVNFRDYFRFCGRFVGKSLIDGQQLSCYFTRSFYKHMLAIPLSLKDLEHVDPEYHKSLMYILEHDVEEVCPDTAFVTEVDFFGRKDVVELKPGGASIMVTNENKSEYAKLAAREKMTTSIREAVEAFQRGMWEVVPLPLLHIFTHAELELLISGLPDIDVADLKRNTVYGGGLSANDRLAQWFWALADEMDKQDVALLLQFVTGTSKVPLGGFGNMFGIAGEQKFTIQKGNGGPERLPTAHTCFNQLDLHKYESKEQLKERLMFAIHEGATGFGFA